MAQIIVNPKNKKESMRLLSLLNEMKIKYIVTNQDKEDEALLAAMSDTGDDTPKPVSELYKEMDWK